MGFLSLIFFLLYLLRHLHKTLLSSKGRSQYLIGGAVFALLFLFLHNIFDFTLGHGIGIQGAVILALADSMSQK